MALSLSRLSRHTCALFLVWSIALLKPSHLRGAADVLVHAFPNASLRAVGSEKVEDSTVLPGMWAVGLACRGLQHLPSFVLQFVLMPRCSQTGSGFRAERQGGIFSLVPASPLLPIWVSACWDSYLPSPTLMGLCLQGHRNWPAKECGSIGCKLTEDVAEQQEHGKTIYP